MVNPLSVGITELFDKSTVIKDENVERLGPRVDAYSSLVTKLLLKST